MAHAVLEVQKEFQSMISEVSSSMANVHTHVKCWKALLTILLLVFLSVFSYELTSTSEYFWKEYFIWFLKSKANSPH